MATKLAEKRVDGIKSNAHTETIPLPKDNGVTLIAPDGDVVLYIDHEFSGSKQSHRCRVHTTLLVANSKYFAGLLQGRFGESERVENAHALLKEKYKAIAKAPLEELPIICIKDLGRISSVKSIEALCNDFLAILHGREIASAPPVANLANLAVISDRFDALDTVRSYVGRKRFIRAIDGKTTPKMDGALSEEKVRQRLLVSAFLDYPPWLDKYSARLITKGWVGREANDTAALWWSLPLRLEEELVFRRDCILDTLHSLQAHLVTLYTSRERQCRLGYDSSAQCDSFQLGEMIRFLSRVGTLSIRGTIFDTAELAEPFEGDLFTLMESLRKVPEYQIDRNHTHCGIRSRLIPLLDIIAESIQHVGICAECWSENRVEYAWMEAKPTLVWRKTSFRLRHLGHQDLHANVKSLFTATERDWNY